jgi:hypothetical protein
MGEVEAAANEVEGKNSWLSARQGSEYPFQLNVPPSDCSPSSVHGACPPGLICVDGQCVGLVRETGGVGGPFPWGTALNPPPLWKFPGSGPVYY